MDMERITALPALPARRADAHKGDFGRVLVVGGSRGMIGAVALTANAAFRGGAGLVSFAAPEIVQQAIATLCPCATSLPLTCERSGELAGDATGEFIAAAEAADVLAAGPGMGVGPQQGGLVQAALASGKPLVLDADGLNNLASIENWPPMRRCPLVVTPHPGEFARLTGRKARVTPKGRMSAASKAVHQWVRASAHAGPLVCVLKGAGTIVTDGRRVYVNATGNPGMATGGTGDVLTGLIAALIAPLIGQGLGLFEAACMGVWAHGRAGDLAAERLGETSLMATDLLDYLPPALQELGRRG